MTTATNITKAHRRLAKRWALTQPNRPSPEAERAYAQGLADGQGQDPGSVLPAYFDDGSSIVVSAMSGGRDYVGGMPRKLTIVHEDADGKSVTRDYLSVTTKSGKTRSRARTTA